MEDDAQDRSLSPEEAGAFVGQWAEHRSVTVDELAAKLSVEPSSVESLLNQAKGRISMDKWYSQKKPSNSSPIYSMGTIAAAATACVLIGGSAVYFLFPRVTERRGNFGGRSPFVVDRQPIVGGFGGPAGLPGGSMGMPGGMGAAGASSDFRPVPGDGDPVQRVGLMIGTEIARATSNEASPAGPSTAVQPPVQNSTVPLPEISATSELRTHAVPIPDDLTIWIRTNTAKYSFEGRHVGNLAAGSSLNASAMLPALGALMTYAMIQSRPQPGEKGIGGPEITLIMGNVRWSKSIEWSQSNRQRLLSMFAVPMTKDAKALLDPFFARVQMAGNSLFARSPGSDHPAVAPISADTPDPHAVAGRQR